MKLRAITLLLISIMLIAGGVAIASSEQPAQHYDLAAWRAASPPSVFVLKQVVLACRTERSAIVESMKHDFLREGMSKQEVCDALGPDDNVKDCSEWGRGGGRSKPILYWVSNCWVDDKKSANPLWLRPQDRFLEIMFDEDGNLTKAQDYVDS